MLCDDIMENEVALKKEQHKSVCSNRGWGPWYSPDFQKNKLYINKYNLFPFKGTTLYIYVGTYKRSERMH